MDARRLRGTGLALVLFATACGGGGTLRPVETVITLKAGEVASKVALHLESDDEIYCGLYTGGTGPRIQPSPSDLHVKAVIGWEFSGDPGTEPFPCGSVIRHDYIAALYFDLTPVIAAGGVVEHAELRFRRSDTSSPIDVAGWGAGASTLYALDPWSDWLGGYYFGDESDVDANPPASLLYGGHPYAPIQFTNSEDPADAAPLLDVTNLISTAVLSRGSRWHGILLSPRPNPSSRADYLATRYYLGGMRTHGSCTGLFGDFELKVTLVRAE